MQRAGLKLAALMTVIVFAFVGCGGDDDDDSAGGGGNSDVTEADYKKAADEICAAGTEELNAAGEKAQAELGEDASLEESAKAFLDDGMPILRDQVEQLQDLDLPAENAQAYEDLFNDYEDALDNLEQMLKSDPDALTDPEQDPFADVNATATELGLTACSALT